MKADSPDPRTAAARIEALVGELGASGDVRVRAAAEDLVRQLLELYGAGLARVMDLAYEQDEIAAAALFERLADDPLVAGLLALHGLHPHTVERRIARALERVRPVVTAAGADMRIIAIDGESVHLRVDNLPGISSAPANVRPLLERVISEAAPEIRRIDIDGGATPAQLLQITRADGSPVSGSRAVAKS